MKTTSISSTLARAGVVAATVLLAACASSNAPSSTQAMSSQDGVPDLVKVPAGNKMVMKTVGVGEITYECRDKKDAAGQYEWVFVGPSAVLNDTSGKQVGAYYGPPATWASSDGSQITGAQVSVAPGGAGNIPFQLVKANPATGEGSMKGVTYIQRLATKGGVAPSTACNAASKGKKETVKYQADYLFWKAA